MTNTEPVHPLKDVWLRPRRVFRELASQPIGITDYLLAAAQGVATSMAVYRTPFAGTHASTAEVLQSALLFGPLGGVVSLYLFAAVYGRLGIRAGGTAKRNQVFHVLAYGGIPVAASLLLRALTAFIVGEAAIVDTPGVATPGAASPAEVDGFVAFVLRLQVAVYLLLLLWSVVLQVMGLSEIQGLTTRKALGVWALGQVLMLLAGLFLTILLAILFPGMVATAPH
ncbi:MAG: YIP1 family protein [Steroidobacteraceae bacterium]